MNVLVTGGTGFIGRPLCRLLTERGHTVCVVTRTPQAQPAQAGVVFLPADPSQPLPVAVEGIVNLAGEPLVATRWSPAQKQRIRDSRVETTRRLVGAMEALPRKPAVLVSASAVGYYGDRGDEELTEGASPGGDFLAQLCQEWEAQARRAESLGVRVVRLRIGIVLGPDGGALSKMAPPFRLGLGGPLGTGRQWVSWIHRDDLIELIRWALVSPAVTGAVNATAPEPVTMRQFAATLGQALRRPSWAPVPPFVLRTLLGEMADVLLASQRVLPEVALRQGYAFRHAQLATALASIW